MRAYQAFWFTSEDERVKLPDLNSASGANGANSASQEDGLTPAWIALFASLLCVSFERMGAYDTKASWSFTSSRSSSYLVRISPVGTDKAIDNRYRDWSRGLQSTEPETL
jgi:hypothetical protein